MNLMLNGIGAMKSMNTPAKLTIKSQQEGGAPEEMEHIFDDFFISKPQGTGMGLAIIRSIIGARDLILWDRDISCLIRTTCDDMDPLSPL